MRAAAALCLVALAAGAARAQEAPSADPIGDVLAAALPPDQSTDSAEDLESAPGPETPMATAAPPPEPLPSPPPRRPALDRPVMIGEVGVSPDGPPTPLDLGYEARIRGSAQAAQGLQGPLDGGWTVRATSGSPIFALQLVDRGQGYGGLEGAWRELGAPVARVGLIDSLERSTILTIRITRRPGRPPAVLTLVPSPDGGWTGDLADESGVRPVTMRRN